MRLFTCWIFGIFLTLLPCVKAFKRPQPDIGKLFKGCKDFPASKHALYCKEVVWLNMRPMKSVPGHQSFHPSRTWLNILAPVISLSHETWSFANVMIRAVNVMDTALHKLLQQLEIDGTISRFIVLENRHFLPKYITASTCCQKQYLLPPTHNTTRAATIAGRQIPLLCINGGIIYRQ